MRRSIAAVRRAAAVAAAVLLAACAGNSNLATQPAATAQDGQPAAATQASALASVGSTDYRIAARDILDINVFQVPDLTKTVQVSEDGNVTLPLIGKINLINKTTHEAENIVADRLRKSYMRAPQVSIFVKQYGQKITISGEVKTPRVIPVDGRVTLTQAIANAGGLADLADYKRVHVARTVGSRIQDEVYDLDAIQSGKAADPVLQGGDLVVAEQSGVKLTLKTMKDLLPFAIFAPLL